MLGWLAPGRPLFITAWLWPSTAQRRAESINLLAAARVSEGEGSGMQTACHTSMFVESLGQLSAVLWAQRLQSDSPGSSSTSA